MDDVKFVLDCLDTGRKIETEGIKFYKGGAETIKDGKGRETLKFLANEEKEHLRFINNLSRSFKENEGRKRIAKIIKEHKNLMSRPKIFPGKAEYEKRIETDNADKEILNEAKKVEDRSIGFYQECKRKVGEQEYKEIFETLEGEEKKHLEWIEMMQGYMDVHGYWYDLYEYFANE
ncbi:MAG: ferritin family protein [Candidatus Hydrothermarchaeales archaeon]